MDRSQSFQQEALPQLDAVYRFALRLTGSAADADDLVQETFLRAFRAWDQYTPGTRVKSWLFTICRNVFLRQREQEQRRAVVAATALPADAAARVEEGPVFHPAYQLDPEGEFFRGLIDDAVLAAITKLPEEFRDAVVLSDLERLSYAEIGRVLDIPIGTVKSRVFRGRRILQQALYDYARDAGYLFVPKK